MVQACADDYRWMARALELAKRGYYSTRPNPRVGCVVVKDNEVVGEGFHYRAGEAHAEVHALEAAGDDALGATAYVTLEPCCHTGRTPPCTAKLIAAKVGRVVCASSDPNPRVGGRGVEQLRDAGITVIEGVMSAEAMQLNRGFLSRMERQSPFVRVKLGTTLDGKIALASGVSEWVTGPAARADVQRLRAQCGAVLTGVGTVCADDPSLNLRTASYDTAGQQPLRVVIDSRLRCEAASQVFHLPGQVLVFTASDDEARISELHATGAIIEQCAHGPLGIDLASVFARLAEYEINEVLVEAGPSLVGSLIRDSLFDELIIYMAPKLFGDTARDGFKLPSLSLISDAPALEFVDVRRVGSDLRIVLRPS
ncbi:MAG: diaminohydroxyphosphoribosylaminopyrimidine deaminase [Gammaproteobacteria bacterium]|jgi:diaminohydroxyphosphoribosylaminopyrimidine deaminase/5-amino-6-(5-phosphoribosylamino)uracil reductase